MPPFTHPANPFVVITGMALVVILPVFEIMGIPMGSETLTILLQMLGWGTVWRWAVWRLNDAEMEERRAKRIQPR